MHDYHATTQAEQIHEDFDLYGCSAQISKALVDRVNKLDRFPGYAEVWDFDFRSKQYK
jgi:hypothetical protein